MMISSGRTTSAYMREREAYTNSTLAVRKCFSCLPQPLSKCHTHTLPCLSARNTHAHTHIHNHQPTHTHARTSLPPTHTHTHVHTRTHTNHETHTLVGHRTDKTFACHLSNMFLKTTPPKQSVRCKAETETARHAYIYISHVADRNSETRTHISHVADRNSETCTHIYHMWRTETARHPCIYHMTGTEPNTQQTTRCLDCDEIDRISITRLVRQQVVFTEW